MAGEFSAPIRLEPLPYRLALATDAVGAEALGRSLIRGEALTRVRDNARLALFRNRWQADLLQREFPGVRLDHLIAAHD
ncbi:hypothetical protein GCM10018777_11490 [Streptomyces albogriseolus]|nr:hypothetical protein GCM10018777_11490 [Streptomyces viridodiastaticus]